VSKATTLSGSSGTANTLCLLPSATQPPLIPDHELLCPIGEGSYGEVWLARNKLGTPRAVKIVYRRTFEDARPFEREFHGIQKFEPISRSHDGFVDILQVGGTDEYFYYVMELADDSNAERGMRAPESNLTRPSATLSRTKGEGRSEGSVSQLSTQSPHNYVARTLRHDLNQLRRLPLSQCVELGRHLASALGHLHAEGLVHRDVKPSNIVFVNGVPKLADIGLVAEASESRSYVGTEGFIPPEGPGAPQGDLYSLGKVLYEISTGNDRRDFPALPDDLAEDESMLELNAVILKACKTEPGARYKAADQFQADLGLLKAGRSVKRKRMLQRRAAAATGFGLVAAAIAFISFIGPRVVRSVAERLPGSAGAVPGIEMNGTQNREAWNAYVKGQHYFKRHSPDGFMQAIGLMEEAIRIDPNFAQAYAALAQIYGWGDYLFPTAQEQMTKVKQVAEKALALDGSLAQTHNDLGYVAWNLERNLPKAEKEYKQAIELSPNDGSPHQGY